MEERAFIKKCLEGVREERGNIIQKSLTIVDIECDMPRAGLGPERVEDLGLIEEDIGLQKSVLIVDYISPPRCSATPFEVNLSAGNIDKC